MCVYFLAIGVQGKSELSCKGLKFITFCKHIRDGHKSNCGSEQLLQQKFKFMVKTLCISKVASCFPFLRSSVQYVTFLHLVFIVISKVSRILQFYTNNVLTVVAYTCSTPLWCIWVPKAITRHKNSL